ncbi:AraC family transcriptional regulator [Alkalimonas mucilaginosa]|uniref:Helix-turn-helix domain-containing protein n=1 Tax=Alkalimonas mucilaginosa TaxID=3057676 RepID=A0ABU7JI42_9GAMM|nr:helix-turn-helix domain-containing protein [Alkalimonas sp. MEB004]MEE2025145.1 helix-turn-helix domain-containing protein [Alkalimonas sp. MEB004]
MMATEHVTKDSWQMLSEMMAAHDVRMDALIEQTAPGDTGSPASMLRLLERFAIEVQDESLHLSERPLMPGTNDYVLSSLCHCTTIQQALQQLANAYNFIHAGNYNQLECNERHLIYRIDDRCFPYTADARQYIAFNLDMVLVFIHGVITTLAGSAVPLLKIKSRNQAASQSPLPATFTETALSFSASCFELHYPAELATRAIQRPDGQILNSALVYSELQRLGTEPFEQSATSFPLKVRLALESGLRDQASVARTLGCSVATLRRRLTAHRTSFRQYKEQLLNQEAKLLLMQQLTLEDIAHKLSFSDARSFKRAFRSWNGISPRQYAERKS